MSLPYNANGLDQILRLANLKNVNGRRRVKGEPPLLPEVSEPEIDVSEINPPLMPKNIPEADMGGELPPQAYDVRANEVIDSSEPQDAPQEKRSFYDKLARLSHLRSGFPMTTGNREIETPEPINSPESIDKYKKYADFLGYRSEPEKPIYQTPKQDETTAFYKSLAESLQSQIPPGEEQVFEEGAQPIPQEQMEELTPEEGMGLSQKYLPQDTSTVALNAKIDEAQKNPKMEVIYGSTDKFANSPELVSDFNRYTGLNFTEKEAEITKKFEKVLSDLEGNLNEQNQGYDEQEARIKERILNNEATDADKFYIGLALLMPMIVGGIFGKEAGLGALGGSFKGLASSFENRQKNIASDEELLMNLKKSKSETSLKRAELELERAKLPEAIKKMMPEDEYKDLKNMNIYEFKDPQTGQVVAEGPEILPGIYANIDYYNTPEKRKEAFKKAEDLADEKAALDTLDTNTIKLIDVAQQLNDPKWFGESLAYLLSSTGSDSVKLNIIKNAPEVYADGRRQNAAIYIDNLLEQNKDAYRRNEKMRALTNVISDHMKSMITNPIYEGYRSRDFIDQLLLVNNKAKDFYVNKLTTQGFLPQPVVSDFGKKNRDLFERMNRVEEKRKVPGLKTEAIKYNATK